MTAQAQGRPAAGPQRQALSRILGSRQCTCDGGIAQSTGRGGAGTRCFPEVILPTTVRERCRPSKRPGSAAQERATHRNGRKAAQDLKQARDAAAARRPVKLSSVASGHVTVHLAGTAQRLPAGGKHVAGVICADVREGFPASQMRFTGTPRVPLLLIALRRQYAFRQLPVCSSVINGHPLHPAVAAIRFPAAGELVASVVGTHEIAPARTTQIAPALVPALLLAVGIAKCQ